MTYIYFAGLAGGIFAGIVVGVLVLVIIIVIVVMFLYEKKEIHLIKMRIIDFKSHFKYKTKYS